MKRAVSHRWTGWQFRTSSVPWALLVICVLAYGLRLMQLGFYWDDWPWIWFSQVAGAKGLLAIDAGYRPLAGEILWLVGQVAGKSPLVWQASNLLFRWLAALAFWWALRKIWPRAGDRLAWAAVIFLLYPGFRQQYVAVNSSRHILPLAIFCLSIGFMVMGVQNRPRRGLYTGTALLCAATAMLATEYYYGLELARPLILWVAIGQAPAENWPRLKRTIISWLPYLALVGMIFTWRYIVAPQGNYPIAITEEIIRQPVSGLLEALRKIWHDVLTTGILAWPNLLKVPLQIIRDWWTALSYLALVTCITILAWIYFQKLEAASAEPKYGKEALALGAFALLVAGLPFLVTGIWVGLAFPSDRTTLPMAFGASLLVAGLLELVVRKRALQILLVSLFVGLGAGTHWVDAVAYQKDWDVQKAFLQQLAWRLPGLEPGTAVIYEYTTALQGLHITDNSLTGPLNWMYAPELSAQEIPYQIYDLRLRGVSTLPSLVKGRPILDNYGPFSFKGSTDALVVIQFAPPGCLQVLRPEYKGLYPHLPEGLDRALRLSNLGRIVQEPPSSAVLPEVVFGQPAEPDWCYYYEKADLYRQAGDWQKIAGLGDQAFTRSDGPRQATERLPFILGYGHTGRWDRASELAIATVRQDRATQRLVCQVWDELVDYTPESAEKSAASERVMAELKCQGL